MKPPPFEYFAPDTLEEALALLAQYGDEAKPLAGGQSLVPVLNFRLAHPAVLVDLNRIEALAGIEAAEGGLRIGAMTRQRRAERDELVRRHAPLIAQALPHVAHPQIRNRGTIGGSIAHADPAGELPALTLALEATLRLRSAASERTVAARDFFTGLFATALASDELLVEVAVPPLLPRSGCAFEEVARRHGDYALLAVAALVVLDDAARCVEARLAYVGAGSGPLRSAAAEAALTGRRIDDAAVRDAAEAAFRELEPGGDVHASADYRRALARVLTSRAVLRAAARVF